MKHIKPILLATATATLFVSGFAQDARVTQQMANPLRVNPAFMGPSMDMKAILHYRSQWGAVDKGYQTYSFTFMYPLYLSDGKHKLDLGVNAMNDREGAFSTLDFALAVGYNIEISNTNSVALSLTGGYGQKAMDSGDLSFDEQYVYGSYSSGNANGENVLSQKLGYPDVGFGLMWNFAPGDDENTEVYFGFSGFHMNEPNLTLNEGQGKLPRKLSAQLGVKIGADNVKVTPNLLLINQNKTNEILAGATVDYELKKDTWVKLGAWYRQPNALAFMVGGEIKGIGLTYSYDIPNSTITRAISGLMTHELTLYYRMRIGKDAVQASY